jgi:hypothetical protein
MKSAYLTKPARPAHKSGMRVRRRAVAGAMVVMGSALASGCISVNAPNEPIVIELNINISQEVIYKLAGDVEQNIEENPEIF